MNDLIAKLEAATEGSRELDGLIAKHLGLPHGPWEKVYVESRSVAYGDEQARYYTTSLDAAMTLVPEGWYIKLESAKPADARKYYHHAVLERDGDMAGRDLGDDEPLEVGALNAATPALALCIAALKAREVQP